MSSGTCTNDVCISKIFNSFSILMFILNIESCSVQQQNQENDSAITRCACRDMAAMFITDVITSSHLAT